MEPTVDLNADVGEERGDDRALLALVSSASIAAGAHAGGGDVLIDTVAAAIDAGCALGAHPSYADRAGFGRQRPADHGTARDLTASLTEQVLLVGRACAHAGTALAYVKPHGALYNDAADNADVADCVLEAVQRAAPLLGLEALSVMGLAGSVLGDRAAIRDVPFVAEAFADRAYDSRGRLVPRSRAGAVLQDAEEISRRVVDIALHGRVRTADGREVMVRAQSICLHGDTPGAVAHARAVREALAVAGVSVRAATP